MGYLRRASRRLVQSAVAGLLLSASVTGLRLISAHAWRPRSLAGVLSFAASELFLLPLTGLLLVLSLLLHYLAGRYESQHPLLSGPDQGTAPTRLALTMVLSAVALSGCLCWFAFPVVSQRWQWGRYGFAPAVQIRSLQQITRATAMQFPSHAVLDDGELMGGLHPYLIAKVQLPSYEVDRYLAMQRPPFSWSDVTTSRNSHGFLAPRHLFLMRHRG